MIQPADGADGHADNPGPAGATLGVVLVNFRSATGIEARLGSGALDGHDVVVVDNGSEPEAVTALGRRFGVAVVTLPENVGFAAGVAAGVDALGPHGQLLLLNPDVDVDRSQLGLLRGAMRPGLDGVAPLLRQPNGVDQVGAAGGPLTLWTVAVYFLGLSHLLPRLTGVFLTRRQARASAGSVAWLCAACLLVRGDVFDRFGPLPTDELVYGEDLAWGTQATSRGARFALATDVEVVHQVGGSGSGDLWLGALTRLARRRLGRRRGGLAVAIIGAGVRARRVAQRPIAALRAVETDRILRRR